MRRNVLKDRSGKISGAIAALLAIIILLIYTRVASTPKGSEDAFYTVYDAFKGFLKALDLLKYVEEYLKPFEEFIKYVQGTELWPLIISILALVVMELAVTAIYCGTWMTIETTSSILGMVSGIRARRRDENKFEAGRKSDKKLAIKTAIFIGKIRISKKTPKDLTFKPSDASVRGSETDRERYLKNLFRIRWWHIRDTFTLVLDKGKLREYVMKAKELYPTDRSPDGSFIELAKAIGIDASSVHRIIRNEGRDSIIVGNLMRLLYLLDIPYQEVTPYIKSIGGKGDKEAIINPKFPIEFYNADGARLLAAALKDGDINIHYHFEYVNYDKDYLRRVNEAVNRIFGEIEPSILYEDNGKQKGIHYQSALIGDILEDAGAVVGRKVDQDYHLPSLIRFGNREMKNAYFDQVIKDEGSNDRGDYRLTITGAGEIETKITQIHNKLLDQLYFERGNWPSGAPKRNLIISEELEKRIPLEFKLVYKDLVSRLEDEWVPKILKEEKELLEKTYDVKANVQLRQIYIGEKVGLRGSWVMIVSGKEDVEKI